MKKMKKGFTLIELLIVIAIIGILASIVLVSLNSARQRARDASALSTIASIAPHVLICLDSNQAIIAPANVSTGGGEICNLTAGADLTWPTLANTGGWNYGAVSSTPATGVYSFAASLPGTGKTITCTDANGCVKAGW